MVRRECGWRCHSLSLFLCSSWCTSRLPPLGRWSRGSHKQSGPKLRVTDPRILQPRFKYFNSDSSIKFQTTKLPWILAIEILTFLDLGTFYSLCSPVINLLQLEIEFRSWVRVRNTVGDTICIPFRVNIIGNHFCTQQIYTMVYSTKEWNSKYAAYFHIGSIPNSN